MTQDTGQIASGAAASHFVPPLTYDYSALAPWINEASLRLHHDFHRARVEVLNAAETQLAEAYRQSDFAWIRYLQQQVALRSSEHLMHCLFWEIMGPNQGGVPRDALADQIDDDFGSFATFKSQFSALAAALETGEWVALVWQPKSERLTIRAINYRHLPCEWAVGILLAFDVSEHAYYLQYQNRRAEYAHNWWNIVRWPRVAERFAIASRPWTTASPTPSRSRQRRRDHDALPISAAGMPEPSRSADEPRRLR